MHNLAIFAACLWAGGTLVWLWWLTHQVLQLDDRFVDISCDIFGMGRRMDSLDRRVDKVAPLVTMREGE